MQVKQIHQKEGFQFAELSGTPADSASVWTFHDEQNVRDRFWKPAQGETVLDIGAQYGSYTLPALARGARVVCFNPAPFDRDLLALNLSLNPELAKRCKVVAEGLYSSDGWFNPDKSQFSETRPSDDGQWFTVRSLQSFLFDHPGIAKVDLIKMDVEGAELEVLKGARDFLVEERPRVLVENHNFHDRALEQKVKSYMESLGFLCDGPHPYGEISHSFFAWGV